MYVLAYDGSNNALVKLQQVPLVGHIRAIGRVLVPADSWMNIIVVLWLHNMRPVPAMMKTIMVLRLCHVDLVPGTADSRQNYSNRAMSIFTMIKTN